MGGTYLEGTRERVDDLVGPNVVIDVDVLAQGFSRRDLTDGSSGVCNHGGIHHYYLWSLQHPVRSDLSRRNPRRCLLSGGYGLSGRFGPSQSSPSICPKRLSEDGRVMQ